MKLPSSRILRSIMFLVAAIALVLVGAVILVAPLIIASRYFSLPIWLLLGWIIMALAVAAAFGVPIAKRLVGLNA